MASKRLGALALAAAACLAVCTSGCLIVDDESDYGPVVYPGDPYYTTIDAGHTLSTDIGYGAGLFVEYTSGGLWRLWTSCDTELTDLTCDFEVSVVSQAPIEAIDGFDLEGYDHIDSLGVDAFGFHAETEYSSDAVEFVTAPGALVDIELVLDGAVAPSYFVWYGNGVVWNGAPRSPVVFQPDMP
jgi:hypothetical protein